ncbi:uncharacterized protein E0L32_007833 [Thyridium curvatum]|uniref:Uncharacterized protein n=1 Tax=Thyridium curvatum TaxID=1093900 RepID=A0A507AY81_9PEZI|nr:uncharacterized protein E0L32_007833 [Thyridium curvatum]TPX11414.1 hypothetical protein E0L32_007833 [Thyridium curvatum]
MQAAERQGKGEVPSFLILFPGPNCGWLLTTRTTGFHTGGLAEEAESSVCLRARSCLDIAPSRNINTTNNNIPGPPRQGSALYFHNSHVSHDTAPQRRRLLPPHVLPAALATLIRIRIRILIPNLLITAATAAALPHPPGPLAHGRLPDLPPPDLDLDARPAALHRLPGGPARRAAGRGRRLAAPQRPLPRADDAAAARRGQPLGAAAAAGPGRGQGGPGRARLAAL